MDLSDRVLGSYIARKLRERGEAVLLRIGRDTFARGDLAHVECFNFHAAATLSAVLTRAMQVKDVRDVFENVPPEALAIPRIGAIAIAVLGAVFEIKGLGGNAPLESWVRRHAEKGAAVHSFASLKTRDAAEAAGERKDRKRRKAARRNQAHAVRVGRFNARQQRATTQ
jgi:hypothetical protein